jgi:hypothetical protein
MRSCPRYSSRLSYDLHFFHVPEGADPEAAFRELMEREESDAADLDAWKQRAWRPALKQFQRYFRSTCVITAAPAAKNSPVNASAAPTPWRSASAPTVTGANPATARPAL